MIRRACLLGLALLLAIPAAAQFNTIWGQTTGSSSLVYNVKAYGAVGDGTTDDTVAIQAALTAAVTAGGGIVYLPAAIYKVTNTLLIGSYVHVVGAGRGATIIRSPAGAYTGKVVNSGTILTTLAMAGSVVGASVQSLTVDHATNGTTANGIAVQIDGAGNYGTNCVIEDTQVLFSVGSQYLIWSQKAVGTKILHNYVDGGISSNTPASTQEGIEVYGGSGVLVDGNTVRNCGQDGIFVWTDATGGALDMVRVINNNVAVAQVGIKASGSATATSNLSIVSNDVGASWVAGIKLLATGSTPINGISIANNTVNGGPVGILLYGGTSTSTRVLVTGNAVTGSTLTDGTGAIDVFWNGVGIYNNAIDSVSGVGIHAASSGNVTASFNQLTNVGLIGITFDTVTTGSVVGNTINHNVANGSNYGIYIVSCSWVNVDQNVISPVHVVSYPIYVNAGDHVSLGLGNVITYATGGASVWKWQGNTTNPGLFSFSLIGAATTNTVNNELVNSTSQILCTQTAGAIPKALNIVPGGSAVVFNYTAAAGGEAYTRTIH